jgi:tetratricopeptide (TPR) repeat protein
MTAPAVHPVAEIERRLQWRWLGLVGFVVLILSLTVLAVIWVMVPPRRVAGLPADAGVRALAATLQGRVPMRSGDLRFRSALTGEAPPDARFGAAETRLVEEADAVLRAAAERRRGDPCLEVALAHLDLARQRYAEAERRYRAVTEHGADAPEARLGLGVALALQAAIQRDGLRARGQRLEALAQFVAVDRDDPVYAVALYDRALLLLELGRTAEATAAARAYLVADPSGPWAWRLRAILAGDAP